MGKKNRKKRIKHKKKPLVKFDKKQISAAGKKQHAEFLNIAAADYEKISGIINSHISGASKIIKGIYPLEILQCAFGKISVASIGKPSESDFSSEDVLLMKMLDYSHCLIVSVPPSHKGYEHLTKEKWEELKGHIFAIYSHLLPYFISATAKRKVSGGYDDKYEEFYTKAQMYWCMVKGERHINHMTTLLSSLLLPHNDVFEELFTISVNNFIIQLNKIREVLTEGLFQSGYKCKNLHAELFERLGPIEEINIPDGMELGQFFALKIEEFGLTDKFKQEAGRFFGYDLFDLQKVSTLPEKLLDELSWCPGENDDFFADGEFKGWPLNLLPTWNRPFIKIEGKYYCFDLYTLSDKIYRFMQKVIGRMKPDYKTLWNKRQKDISEQLPFDLFLDLLPGAKYYKSVYYRWKTGKQKKANWSECDGLIIYQDHLFIVEIKAGSFTYTPPATDFPAYISSIKSLILTPIKQGQRFKEYLLSEDIAYLHDESHQPITNLSHKQFRNITVCCLTIDTFTELAAQAQNLKNLVDGISGENNWVLSLDDLLVYKDIMNNPLQFLHFVEQRNTAYGSCLMDLEDELDHLALYLKHNCYVQHAEEMIGNQANVRIVWEGARKEIDEFYSKSLVESMVPPPKQEMPTLMRQIIDCMAIKRRGYEARAVSTLLNMDNIGRKLLFQQAVGS